MAFNNRSLSVPEALKDSDLFKAYREGIKNNMTDMIMGLEGQINAAMEVCEEIDLLTFDNESSTQIPTSEEENKGQHSVMPANRKRNAILKPSRLTNALKNYSSQLPTSLEANFKHLMEQFSENFDESINNSFEMDKSHQFIYYDETLLNHRTICLQYIEEFCEKINLDNIILHRSVRIMDAYFEAYALESVSESYLLIMACIRLAVKLEKPKVLLKTTDMNIFFRIDYLKADLRNFELKIIDTVKINILPPTIAHFGNYFARYFIDIDDFKVYQQQNFLFSTTDIKEAMKNMIKNYKNVLKELLNLCLCSPTFCNCPPSLVAAVCAYTTRKIMGAIPFWKPYLKDLFRLDYNDIVYLSSILSKMYACYNLNYKKLCYSTTKLEIESSDESDTNTPQDVEDMLFEDLLDI